MSKTATVVVTTTVAGATTVSTLERTNEGAEALSLDIAAGIAGTLTTRTSATAGVLTVASGHGITTSNIVSVHFDAGVAYNFTVSATTSTTITIASGAGTALPIATSAIVVSAQISNAVSIVGDNLIVLSVYSAKRSFVNFRSSAPASLLLHQVTAGEGRIWVSGTDVTNPLAGVTVATIHVSNGETRAGTVEIGILKSTV